VDGLLFDLPHYTIFLGGMNIHESQLFWGSPGQPQAMQYAGSA
jgi:hypothetical protein